MNSKELVDNFDPTMLSSVLIYLFEFCGLPKLEVLEVDESDS